MSRKSDNTALNYIAAYFEEQLNVMSPTGHSISEKALISVNADPTTTTIDLVGGTTGQVIRNVLISIPGATGDIIINFYDPVIGGNVLLASYYLINMPTTGFVINNIVTTGSLLISIAGVTNPTKKAYLSISYGY